MSYVHVPSPSPWLGSNLTEGGQVLVAYTTCCVLTEPFNLWPCLRSYYWTSSTFRLSEGYRRGSDWGTRGQRQALTAGSSPGRLQTRVWSLETKKMRWRISSNNQLLSPAMYFFFIYQVIIKLWLFKDQFNHKDRSSTIHMIWCWFLMHYDTSQYFISILFLAIKPKLQ